MRRGMKYGFRKIINHGGRDVMERGTWEVWAETHIGIRIAKFNLPDEIDNMFDYINGCRFSGTTYHVFDTKGNLTDI